MINILLLAASVAFAQINITTPNFADLGTPGTGKLTSWKLDRTCMVKVDGQEYPMECMLDSKVDMSKVKVGAAVQLKWTTGFNRSAMIYWVEGMPKPAPAPAPAPPKPAPAPAVPSKPTATIKTFDPQTRQGTMTPDGGGKDLWFVVDPKATGTVKVGAKVEYVEAVVTAVK